jgi:hypothetical protein
VAIGVAWACSAAAVPKVAALARKVYLETLGDLAWATGSSVLAIPLAAGMAVSWGSHESGGGRSAHVPIHRHHRHERPADAAPW